MRTFYCCVFLLLLTQWSSASTGTLRGKVTDKDTGEELVGTTVYIEGTTKGTITDFNGNYILDGIETGVQKIACRSVSYEPVVVDVHISEGETVCDFPLYTVEVDLEEVMVMAIANRASENMLLMEQKKASIDKATIGAQELAAQGVSDAGNAVSKVSGVSGKNGGGTINVRGLGDRYNSTTLNGLPLPSNDTKFKNIDLGLFSTGVIEYIGVEKVFSSSMYGDVAGANVDIVSKKFTGKSFLTVGVKSGGSSNVSAGDDFYLQDGPGFWGFDNFSEPSDLDHYEFENSLNPVEKSIYPNIGIGMDGGHSFEMGDSKLNFYGSFSFDNNLGRSDVVRRKVNGSDNVRQDLTGERFSYETQTTGILNLNYSNKNTEIYYNSLFLNSSNQELNHLNGYEIDVVGDPDKETAFQRRSEFIRNVVRVNQLLGTHQLSKTLKLNWAVGYNDVNNIIPDRRHNVFVIGEAIKPSDNDASNNHRYFHDLVEQEVAGNISITKAFGNSIGERDHRGMFAIGYSGKTKQRSFEAFQYNHALNKEQIGTLDLNDVDAYFNEKNLQAGAFSIKTFFDKLNVASTYDGEQYIHAGFGSLEYAFSKKFLGVFGVRVEKVLQKIEFNTSLDEGEGEFDEFNIFPSISLKYSLTEKSNLRFSSSIQNTLPQFKETARFLFEDGTDSEVGNPSLYPSKDYNVDFKWEYFPKAGEVIAVAGFGKYIDSPINRFVMNSASNDFTYANTGEWGYVLGVEVDAKKHLWVRNEGTKSSKILLAGNVSLLHSKQSLNDEKVKEETGMSVSFTEEDGALQGAAPVLANASISHLMTWKDNRNTFKTTFVYGYTSDRLYLIGSSSSGSQYDQAISSMDFVVKSKLNKVGITFSLKNILNQSVERIQENATRDHLVRSFKGGVNVRLGLTYTF